MATITERGDYQFQEIIRRKGYPAQTKTFESRADAERWVREVEANIDTGHFRDRREVERTTLGQANETGMVAEKNRILKLQSNPHIPSSRPRVKVASADWNQYNDEPSFSRLANKKASISIHQAARFVAT